MHLMRVIDPSGVQQRRKRRLKRRAYHSKVNYLIPCVCIINVSHCDIGPQPYMAYGWL